MTELNEGLKVKISLSSPFLYRFSVMQPVFDESATSPRSKYHLTGHMNAWAQNCLAKRSSLSVVYFTPHGKTHYAPANTMCRCVAVHYGLFMLS